jgi:hypothetical protein
MHGKNEKYLCAEKRNFKTLENILGVERQKSSGA